MGCKQKEISPFLCSYDVPVSSGEDPDTIIVPIYMKEKK